MCDWSLNRVSVHDKEANIEIINNKIINNRIVIFAIQSIALLSITAPL